MNIRDYKYKLFKIWTLFLIISFPYYITSARIERLQKRWTAKSNAIYINKSKVELTVKANTLNLDLIYPQNFSFPYSINLGCILEYRISFIHYYTKLVLKFYNLPPPLS